MRNQVIERLAIFFFERQRIDGLYVHWESLEESRKAGWRDLGRETLDTVLDALEVVTEAELIKNLRAEKK